MSAELTPTEQEINWWTETKDRYDEAEALVGWLDEYIAGDRDLIMRASRYADPSVEITSHLQQIRDSMVWVWGIGVGQSSPALAK
ncbi:hypothetical protein [Kineococcus sp. NPDC059986]|uniref:hypothetical protein n=1 Tax=Kineococcus sp. NPDC059986 TaxID=3155538 RepID=UPI00344E67F1